MGSKRQDLYMPIINVTIILVAEGKVNQMEYEVGKNSFEEKYQSALGDRGINSVGGGN